MPVEKNNKKITRKKGEFVRYEIKWYNICHRCDPFSPKKSRSVVESYVNPRWDISELFP